MAIWSFLFVATRAAKGWSVLCVLGAVPRKLDGLDLRACGMVMECRGEPVSVGAGVACLGSPISASLWLARVMAREGHPLLAGDVLLSRCRSRSDCGGRARATGCSPSSDYSLALSPEIGMAHVGTAIT